MDDSLEIVKLEELGQQLRKKRKSMKVTQKQAAQLCNVGARFIGELERGKATAEIGKALQVINGYGFKLILTGRRLS